MAEAGADVISTGRTLASPNATAQEILASVVSYVWSYQADMAEPIACTQTREKVPAEIGDRRADQQRRRTPPLEPR